MAKNKSKITEWGQIKLICPCGGAKDSVCDFDIVKFGYTTYYKCTNPDCPNVFATDYHIKIMDWLNKYYEKNQTFDGFVHYFTARDCSMRARYVETKAVTDSYFTVVIEVANLTKMKLKS